MSFVVRWRVHLALVGVALACVVLAGASSSPVYAGTCPARYPLPADALYSDFIAPAAQEVLKRAGILNAPTQAFGPTSLTIYGSAYGYPHFHLGIDNGWPRGTPVYAPWGGTVHHYYGGGWGTGAEGPNQVMELNLSTGMKWYVFHNSDLIAEGPVKAGTLVSRVGSTGASTGPHTHSEARNADGSNIPPEWWGCKAGDSPIAGEPTASTTTTDYAETSATSSALPAPWVTLTGAGDILDGAIRATVSDFKAGVPSHADTGNLSAVLGGTDIADAGLVFRYVDANNFMLYQCAGGHNRLYEIVGGSATELFVVEPCESGKPLSVSWTADSIKLTDRAGGVHTVASGRFAGQAKYAGVRAYRLDTRITAFKYTQNADGTPTATAEPGADAAATDPANADGGWGPIGWLWDRVRGLLIPSDTDWQEIAAEFDKLTDKEPIGTIKDIAGFMGGLKFAMTTAATDLPICDSMAADQVRGTAYEGVFDGISAGCIIGKASETLGPIADGMSRMQFGVISALGMVKGTMSFGFFLGFVAYVRSRFHLAV